MQNRSNFVFGFILVIIGVTFLLRNMNIINFDINIGFIFAYFWPMFIIIPGLIMHLSYFGGRNVDPGILVPGGILLTVGATLQVSMLFNIWDITWPGYILAVAVGLFELYLFGTRDKALLIPVGILGGLSLIFIVTISIPLALDHSIGQYVVPIVLVLVGAALIFKDRSGTKKY